MRVWCKSMSEWRYTLYKITIKPPRLTERWPPQQIPSLIFLEWDSLPHFSMHCHQYLPPVSMNCLIVTVVRQSFLTKLTKNMTKTKETLLTPVKLSDIWTKSDNKQRWTRKLIPYEYYKPCFLNKFENVVWHAVSPGTFFYTCMVFTFYYSMTCFPIPSKFA